MQITATRIFVRCRVLAVAACIIAASASTLMAQLRFAGPSNQADEPLQRGRLSRSDEVIRQAQFRPIRSVVGQSPTVPLQVLAPQVPAPSDEASLRPGPLSSGELTPAPIPESDANVGLSVSSDTIEQEIPATVDGIPLGTSWQDSWGDPLSPELMQQEQAIFYSTNQWFRRGCWYSQAEVVVLLRTEGQDVVISADNTGGGLSVTDLNAPILTSKTVDPTYTTGTRLTLGRFLGQDVANRDYSIEFAFLGLFDYSERATMVSLSPNGLVDGLGPGNHYFSTGVTGVMVGAASPGFGDAQRHDIRYDSDFNSFEMNFRIMGRPLRDRINLQPNGSWVRNGSASNIRSMLIGLRTISVNELFQLQASFNNPETSGDYRVRTANDMFGIQIGGELLQRFSSWSWGARFKAGGLFNFADRQSSTDVFLSGVRRDPRDELVSSENLSAVLEAGMMATYEIRANLVARIAYDATYIQGIATAPENLGLADAFPNFEVTGDVLYHGLSVGFEMLW